MSNRVRIDISTATILKTALIILGIIFLYFVRDIAVLFFIVLIIAAALTPLVNWMAKIMPRLLAVVILGLVFLGILTGAGFLFIPPLVLEIKQLAINLPIIIAKLGPIYHNIQGAVSGYQEILLNVSAQISKLTNGIFSTTVSLISGVIGFITMIVMVFYMLVERDSINGYILNMIPESKRAGVMSIVQKISTKMGQWLGGHLLLMVIIGVLNGVVLTILGIPYALILAIWSGLMEIIPYVGPWLGLIPALIIAFTISPWTALIVLIAYILIQQLEAVFLVPKIIGKAVGLSPVIIILSLLIGAKLMGVMGVIIAVPFAAAISVLIQEWPEITKLREKN